MKTRSGKLEKTALVETVKEGSKSLIHIVNDPDGGFVLVSASKDYYPVLAYSDDGVLDLSSENEIIGLKIWMEETKAAIKSSETFDEESKAMIRGQWASFDAGDNMIVDSKLSAKSTTYSSSGDAMQNRMNALYYQYGQNGWYTYTSLADAQSYFANNMSVYNSLCSIANARNSPLDYTIVAIKNEEVKYQTLAGPLTSTTWHQRPPFNTAYNSTLPLGCGVVALAQIMKFHKRTGSFDWSNMPNTGGETAQNLNTSSTPAFMNELRDRLGLKPGETTVGEYQMGQALYNSGYGREEKNHNSTGVKDQILAGKPVCMFGSYIDVPNGLKGHIWVCDGVASAQSKILYFVEYKTNNGYSNYGYTSHEYPGIAGPFNYSNNIFFYMNWGFQKGDTVEGGWCNGWFLNNDNNGVDISERSMNIQYNRLNIYIYPPA